MKGAASTNSSGKGKLIVVSAPSGAGKTSIVKRILQEFPSLIFSVSATTRKKRTGETEGSDYYFISRDDFKKGIGNGDFLEYERVYDHYYGTYRRYVEENIVKGRSVLAEIDVKGALSLKSIYPDAFLIYIMPPDSETLAKRLRNRKTEDENELHKRIRRAEMELSMKDKFDYFVINVDLDTAVSETKKIITEILNKEI